MKTIQETEALFTSNIDVWDCFCLRKSHLALQAELGAEFQAELRAEALLVVKELQKQACHFVKISYQKKSKVWPSTM